MIVAFPDLVFVVFAEMEVSIFAATLERESLARIGLAIVRIAQPFWTGAPCSNITRAIVAQVITGFTCFTATRSLLDPTVEVACLDCTADAVHGTAPGDDCVGLDLLVGPVGHEGFPHGQGFILKVFLNVKGGP